MNLHTAHQLFARDQVHHNDENDQMANGRRQRERTCPTPHAQYTQHQHGSSCGICTPTRNIGAEKTER